MRWWNEFVGAIGAIVPLAVVVVLLLAAASLVAALWYLFPAWVPRRWPRFRKPRWRLRWPRWRWPLWRWRWRWRWPLWSRKRRRKRAEATPEPDAAEPTTDEEVPELPATTFVDLADRLAAEGRYAEAIRERLRGMVRELIEHDVLEHRPGWTVTELAAVAAGRRPAVAGPLGAAGALFSDVWYGARPAHAEHDARMRELARGQTAALAAATRPVGARPVGAPA